MQMSSEAASRAGPVARGHSLKMARPAGIDLSATRCLEWEGSNSQKYRLHWLPRHPRDVGKVSQ